MKSAVVALSVLATQAAAGGFYAAWLNPSPGTALPTDPTKWTTSTAYITRTQTITSCPPFLTSCSSYSTVLTAVVPVSTILGPLTETDATTTTETKESTSTTSSTSSSSPSSSSLTSTAITTTATTRHPALPLVDSASFSTAPAPTTTLVKTKVVGSFPPPKALSCPSAATGGAVHNVQRAGGVLVALVVVVVLL